MPENKFSRISQIFLMIRLTTISWGRWMCCICSLISCPRITPPWFVLLLLACVILLQVFSSMKYIQVWSKIKVPYVLFASWHKWLPFFILEVEHKECYSLIPLFTRLMQCSPICFWLISWRLCLFSLLSYFLASLFWLSLHIHYLALTVDPLNCEYIINSNGVQTIASCLYKPDNDIKLSALTTLTFLGKTSASIWGNAFFDCIF